MRIFVKKWTPALASVLLLMLITSCVPQKVLNYALKRDAKADTREYEAYYKGFAKKGGERKAWLEAMRDTFIVSEQDGVRLHGLFRAADTLTTRTVVFLHGYGGSSVRFLDYAYYYNKVLGLNVLLPDFYAHGKSEGRMRRMGWLDRLDMLQWMQVADSLFRGSAPETQMLVTGVSMGGAATMMVSGEVEKAGLSFVKCFVEDCGYTDVYDQFSFVSKGKFRWVLNWANRRCKRRYGWDFKEASSREQVAKCHLPMLFIHGGHDTYVPTSMVHEVYDAKEGDKELWIPEGVEHAVSFYHAGKEYHKRVKAFLEKYLR